jgi:hypothetical protein
MGLPPGFREQLAVKSDLELYEILAHEQDYLPEALDAARQELANRDLPPDRAAELESVVQSQAAAASAMAEQRLGWPMRLLVFFLCSGILGVTLAVYYDTKGYKAKAKDCWTTAGLSFAAHVFLGALRLSTR